MTILRFESEDFDVHDLLFEFQQTPLPDGVTVAVNQSAIATKDERTIYVDILEVASRIDVNEELLRLILTSAVTFGFVKIKNLIFAKPYILLRFRNKASRKIEYDKGDAAIVEELMGYIEKGDVESVVFKSKS